MTKELVKLNAREIGDLLNSSNFTSDELNQIKDALDYELTKRENSNKVKIYWISNGSWRVYVETKPEIKKHIQEEINACDVDDVSSFEISVGERYVAEADLPDYIGKIHVY